MESGTMRSSPIFWGKEAEIRRNTVFPYILGEDRRDLAITGNQENDRQSAFY